MGTLVRNMSGAQIDFDLAFKYMDKASVKFMRRYYENPSDGWIFFMYEETYFHTHGEMWEFSKKEPDLSKLILPGKRRVKLKRFTAARPAENYHNQTK